ncbi:hypothetical protein EDD86DRAFT_244172 [Gorgonomyces haynaldii]|nr:hypothetical protein EDD86DRAFT_244172 [Gorgonomyces haynaldii]
MSVEFDKYQFQIDQIDIKLQQDPDNEELLKLKQDLLLLQSQVTETKQAQPVSKPQVIKARKRAFNVGETCMCQWDDGNFYEAIVLSVGEQYEVAFTGYDEIRMVDGSRLKESKLKEQVEQATQEVVVGDIQEQKEKKKFQPKKERNLSKKEKEINQKRNDWLAFSAGVKKKQIPTKQTQFQATATKRKHIFAKPVDEDD